MGEAIHVESLEIVQKARKRMLAYIKEHWGSEPDWAEFSTDKVPADEVSRYPLYFLWMLDDDIFRAYGSRLDLREYLICGIGILAVLHRMPDLENHQPLHDFIQALDAEFEISKIRTIFKGTRNPEPISDQSLEKFVLELVGE